MKHIAIIGAGGKMGYRVSANLRNSSYRVSHIEVSEAGRLRLHELGITCVEAAKALPEAASKAVERSKRELVGPDWKRVFEPDAIRESIHMITRA